jgi:hypothetical protein
MKTPLPFIICIALIISGFVIGGRDGAIMSIAGSAALLCYSFWLLIKLGKAM